MKTVSASDANRQFSRLLQEVKQGEVITVVSRGKPVATLMPVEGDAVQKESARKRLVQRLRRQSPSGKRDWTRGELYD